ncbi:MAG: helix-turn-helix domain-containing protein [Woeseiaceae bacterium]|nr:helix-turn-helix domain-containing protein [Woeseiaceae bacterium]
MEFVSHETIEPCADWIEAVFHYKGFEPDHSIERVVPTGHVFVLFELDGYTRHTFDNASLTPNADFRKAWVSGVHDEYLSISAHQDSEMFVIQFKPYGAYPFLKVSMDKLANRVVAGEDLLEGELMALRDELFAAPTSEAKFALADDWLTKRFSGEHVPPAGVVGAAAAIAEQPTAKLSQALDAFDGTNKHLIDLFRRYVGITPKVFQRILRFNDVFRRIRENGTIDWAEVANQCGYADQSHFIREFRRFSGFNPAEFIRAGVNNDEGNFFPLDREG